MCVCMCIYIYIHIHIYIYIYTHTYTYVHTFVHLFLYVYTHIITPVHVHTLLRTSEVTFRDIAELRSFRNPPAVVCQVLEASPRIVKRCLYASVL